MGLNGHGIKVEFQLVFNRVPRHSAKLCDHESNSSFWKNGTTSCHIGSQIGMSRVLSVSWMKNVRGGTLS